MMKRSLTIITALILLLTGAMSALGMDYDKLARQVLKCQHPTVDPAEAQVDLVRRDRTMGHEERVRVKVYYKGWFNRNELTMDLITKETHDSILLHADILADSASLSSPTRCDYTVGWIEIASRQTVTTTLPTPPQQPVQTAPPTTDVMQMKNGDLLSGELLLTSVPIETSYAKISVPIEEIQAIELTGGWISKDSLTRINGDRLQGNINLTNVPLRMNDGTQVVIERGQILKVTLRRR